MFVTNLHTTSTIDKVIWYLDLHFENVLIFKLMRIFNDLYNMTFLLEIVIKGEQVTLHGLFYQEIC